MPHLLRWVHPPMITCTGRHRTAIALLLLCLSLLALTATSCGGETDSTKADISVPDVEAVFHSAGIELIESVSPAQPESCLRAVLVPRQSAGDELAVTVLCNDTVARGLFRQASGGSEDSEAHVRGEYLFAVRNLYVTFRPGGDITLEKLRSVLDQLEKA